MEGHRLMDCESLYFQESPLGSQSFVALMVYSPKPRGAVSYIRSPGATNGHRLSRDPSRHGKKLPKHLQ